MIRLESSIEPTCGVEEVVRGRHDIVRGEGAGIDHFWYNLVKSAGTEKTHVHLKLVLHMRSVQVQHITLFVLTLKIWIAFSTPSCPYEQKAYKKGRPTPTAFAPNAMALRTSLALLTPPSM